MSNSNKSNNDSFTVEDSESVSNNANNVLSQILNHPLTKKLDDRTQKAMEKLSKQPLANRIFYTASQLGDNGLIWQLLAALRALFGNKKHEQNYYRLTAALAVESFLVNGVIKSYFPRKRPDVDDNDRPLYLRQPITGSFPSGHASSAVLASVLLKIGKRKTPFTFLTWILAGVITSSRIYVKIHHGSDVIAGALVGYSLAKIVKKIWKLTN